MAPLAASAHDVEQAIKQMAHVGCSRSTSGLGWGNDRLDQAILVIAQSLTRSKVADPFAIRKRPHFGLQMGKPPGHPQHGSPCSSN